MSAIKKQQQQSALFRLKYNFCALDNEKEMKFLTFAPIIIKLFFIIYVTKQRQLAL